MLKEYSIIRYEDTALLLMIAGLNFILAAARHDSIVKASMTCSTGMIDLISQSAPKIINRATVVGLFGDRFRLETGEPERSFG